MYFDIAVHWPNDKNMNYEGALQLYHCIKLRGLGRNHKPRTLETNLELQWHPCCWGNASNRATPTGSQEHQHVLVHGRCTLAEANNASDNGALGQYNGYAQKGHMARLAQSAERKALNLVVVGSSPTVGVFSFFGNANTCWIAFAKILCWGTKEIKPT